MKPAVIEALPQQDEIRMGSEYATARDYLARPPRKPSALLAPRRKKPEPQHGSNDSDFGFADQRAE